MRTLTKSIAAAGLTATLLAAGGLSAQAATSPMNHVSAPQSASETINVNTVHAGDRYVTGNATGDAARVSIIGAIPGRGIDGAVAADGSFSVDLAPFQSRIYPMQRLSVNALNSTGTLIGSSNFIVDFKAPEAPKPQQDLLIDSTTTKSTQITGTATPGSTVLIEGIVDARPGAFVTSNGKFSVHVANYTLTANQKLTAVNVDSGTLQPLGKQTAFTVGTVEEEPTHPSSLQIDPFHPGQQVLTGVVPSGSLEVAIEVYDGTTKFGTIDENGRFSIPLEGLAYTLRPGFSFTVWVIDANGNVTETTKTIGRY